MLYLQLFWRTGILCVCFNIKVVFSTTSTVAIYTCFTPDLPQSQCPMTQLIVKISTKISVKISVAQFQFPQNHSQAVNQESHHSLAHSHESLVQIRFLTVSFALRVRILQATESNPQKGQKVKD